MAAVILSACTTATPPGLVGTAQPTNPEPFMTAIDGMTVVPESVECADERLDGRRSNLPGPQLIPAAFPGVVAVRLVRPGRDASDARCHPTLVKRFSCRDASTWAEPDPTEFLLTFGAPQVRVVEGTSSARTQSTADGRTPAEPKRSFTYAEYDLAPGDPLGAVAFEQHAFATCAPATERVVNGVAMRTASVGTETGLVDVAFLVAGDRLAQVVLSGSRWAADERDHAWLTVAQHLRLEE
ncbi:hypothetical protein [Intrasporangium sp. YIM S08009]|uniref:hypothetical protein n=1 Tax=Intrasporangium zincisolvens TaxID=3080018 RepID=UPI002B057BD8|nr:hypothetical protein [Intrasporangium sp. YIM S08009]